MPHTTVAYPFELKVFKYASELSAKLTGQQGQDGFLMLFGERTEVVEVQVGPRQRWEARRAALGDHGTFLLFDPFEPDEYAWLEWHMAGATMVRLLGVSLEAADFVRMPHAGTRRGKLEAPGRFPTRWGVMF